MGDTFYKWYYLSAHCTEDVFHVRPWKRLCNGREEDWQEPESDHVDANAVKHEPASEKVCSSPHRSLRGEEERRRGEERERERERERKKGGMEKGTYHDVLARLCGVVETVRYHDAQAGLRGVVS